MNKNKFLILFLLIFTVSVSVFAQNIQELRVGSSLPGYINHGQEIWYRVRTAGFGLLVVETTGEIDTFLEVYDAQRKFIIENDDGDDLNAKIMLLTGADKTFLIKLKGYESDITGPFTVSASFSAMTNPAALRVDSALRGNIERGQTYLFAIQSPENGILSVRTTGDTDTVMQAYDMNSNFLAENDDDGEDINSKIDILAKAGENYYFLVRGFSEEDFGFYNLSASFSELPELSLNSSLNSHLESYGKNWYSVRAVKNGHLVLEVSSNFDTYMEVYDENFKLIADDDDSGDDLDAKIEIEAKAGMTYYIIVSGYGPEDTGSFRISARSK